MAKFDNKKLIKHTFNKSDDENIFDDKKKAKNKYEKKIRYKNKKEKDYDNWN